MLLNLNEKEIKKAQKFKNLCEDFNSKLNKPHATLCYRYLVEEPNCIGQACTIECMTLEASEEITNYSSW